MICMSILFRPATVVLRSPSSSTAWQAARRLVLQRGSASRHDVSPGTDYQTKYAEKLLRRAQDKGLTVGELRAKAREEAEAEAKAKKAKNSEQKRQKDAPRTTTSSPSRNTAGSSVQTVRKDNSSVRPLSAIFNLSRLLSTPHSAEQVSALWTAYHATAVRTGGAYICASVPVDAYERMARAAERYSSFVLPVPRSNAGASADTTSTGTGNDDAGHSPPCEFYFMQWAFHDSPSRPNGDDIDNVLSPAHVQQHADRVHPGTSNPRTSTVLFTPLREYKLRGTFATPHLVLTHYTDLARTHGLVLLRGEITPSNSSTVAAAAVPADQSHGQYLISQQDAQILAMGVQRFYLWGQEKNGVESEGERLLKAFHETPGQFNWEELLKYADLAA